MPITRDRAIHSAHKAADRTTTGHLLDCIEQLRVIHEEMEQMIDKIVVHAEIGSDARVHHLLRVWTGFPARAGESE